MEWSRDQLAALDAVYMWLDLGSEQVFRLFGPAGTGKTTLAKKIAERSGSVLFAAYTGKAAHVLQRAGCHSATTIHSLIYRPREKSRSRLRELQEQLANAETEAKKYPEDISYQEEICLLDRAIAEEKKNIKKPSFELNLDSEVKYADLLIIDECSMVNGAMADDMLYFGTKVLVLGDPAQLPPVRGSGFFTECEPNFMLTEIHRQAKDNPIIAMATIVREGGTLDYGTYGDSQVIRLKDFDPDAVSPEAQILVGMNKTRRRANARCRKNRGFTDPLPVAGDKLVCLRNNHEIGLLNGAIWFVVERLEEPEAGLLSLNIRDEEGRTLDVTVHTAPFLGEEIQIWDRKCGEEFEMGYALTVHKAQGSGWPEVVLVDEGSVFRKDQHRWRYTGITRASEKITIVR